MRQAELSSARSGSPPAPFPKVACPNGHHVIVNQCGFAGRSTRWSKSSDAIGQGAREWPASSGQVPQPTPEPNPRKGTS